MNPSPSLANTVLPGAPPVTPDHVMTVLRRMLPRLTREDVSVFLMLAGAYGWNPRYGETPDSDDDPEARSILQWATDCRATESSHEETDWPLDLPSFWAMDAADGPLDRDPVWLMALFVAAGANPWYAAAHSSRRYRTPFQNCLGHGHWAVAVQMLRTPGAPGVRALLDVPFDDDVGTWGEWLARKKPEGLRRVLGALPGTLPTLQEMARLPASFLATCPDWLSMGADGKHALAAAWREGLESPGNRRLSLNALMDRMEVLYGDALEPSWRTREAIAALGTTPCQLPALDMAFAADRLAFFRTTSNLEVGGALMGPVSVWSALLASLFRVEVPTGLARRLIFGWLETTSDGAMADALDWPGDDRSLRRGLMALISLGFSIPTLSWTDPFSADEQSLNTQLMDLFGLDGVGEVSRSFRPDVETAVAWLFDLADRLRDDEAALLKTNVVTALRRALQKGADWADEGLMERPLRHLADPYRNGQGDLLLQQLGEAHPSWDLPHGQPFDRADTAARLWLRISQAAHDTEGLERLLDEGLKGGGVADAHLPALQAWLAQQACAERARDPDDRLLSVEKLVRLQAAVHERCLTRTLVDGVRAVPRERL